MEDKTAVNYKTDRIIGQDAKGKDSGDNNKA